MTKNEQWLKMINCLNIDVTPEIASGELVSRELSSNSLYWRLTLKFPKVLKCDYMKSLTAKIKDFMMSNLNAKDIKFTFIYDDPSCDENYKIEYLNDAIDILSKVNKDITILKTFKYHFDDECIVYVVHSDQEKKVVNFILSIVSLYFSNFGLTDVRFNCEAEGGLDVKSRHEVEFQSEENSNSAKAMENYYRAKEEETANEVQLQYTGYKFKGYNDIKIENIPLTSMEVSEYEQINGTNKVAFSGVVVSSETRNIKSKAGKELHLFIGVVTDYKDSIQIKRFYNDNEKEIFEKTIKPNLKVEIIGKMQWDNYANQVSIMCDRINISGEDTYRKRFDGQPEKRVELHAHTKMSVMDSILNVEEYVDQAKRFGHTALAVTDHENCHVLPEFFSECKKVGIKPIAGIESNFVDYDDAVITLTNEDIPLKNAVFTVFDIETTGFFIKYQEIIEIGAVKVQNGIIIDTFSEFVKPKHSISEAISKLTNITNDDVYDALTINEVLPEFKKFIEGTILVAHNAKFDTEFIYEKMKDLGIFEKRYPCIDTLQVARYLYADKGLTRFNLGSLAKFLKVELEQQHRAIYDARSTNNVLQRMLGDIEQLEIDNYKDLNSLVDHSQIYKYEISTHITLLVKNKVGLKNFYKIISDSNVTHFARNPKIIKEVLDQYHEGVLIGSSCVNGAVFRAAIEKNDEILRKKIKMYDYIEVQPPKVYQHLFEKTPDEHSIDYIQDCIKRIIKIAREEGKIVVATGDVHELIKEDSEFRKIYIVCPRPNGGGVHELADIEETVDMHFLSTTEMLNEFDFLSAEDAKEIVITNTNKIADMVESYDLFPKDLFVPKDDFRKDYGVPSMKQAIYDQCDQTSHAIYGDIIPQYVKDRLERELDSIISHGYFSVYYISHLLVKDSNDHGFVVGSRGSVGSSFVAHMMNITEVNPLAPHYVCPKCHFTAFKFNQEQKQKYPQPNLPEDILEELEKTNNGYDLPVKKCPYCGETLNRLGMDIAFETFLGFAGDKVPDIDLNFSGDYQAQAHLFCQEVFGKDHSFRAGTVSTANDKTAYAFARDYYATKGISKRQAELDRLAKFLSGSKRTTGQHPGGIVVVPKYMDIFDITPIQYPPIKDVKNMAELDWCTTHFEYHSFENNLLKLDILGQDNPTCIKMLVDYTKEFPDEFDFHDVVGIPFIDKDVLSLFSSKEALHLDGDDLDKLTSGTIGIPEFGTNFVRGMLETIKPKTVDDIIKVSGLSHGTDVWSSNAESLVKGEVPGFPKVEFKAIIGCRDDIMIYLMHQGINASDSFKIMETVRKKGKVLSPEQIQNMKQHGVPEWYIWTCNKIQYLFPKAHATAYVIDALRIAWFKVHAPIYYYSVYFTVRATAFDVDVMPLGKNAIRNRLAELQKKIQDHTATDKEMDLADQLQIALEMVLRGYRFRQIDLYRSEAKKFVIDIDHKSLYLPFIAIDSLGENVANAIVEERNKRPFTSIQDIEERHIINKTQFAKLKTLGVFDGLEKNENNTLFSDDVLKKLDL